MLGWGEVRWRGLYLGALVAPLHQFGLLAATVGVADELGKVNTQ